MATVSAGARLWSALEAERPLQVVGTVNAYSALLAERAGFRAIYLSGGGVAAASLGVPDLGITTLEDVLIDARRITDVTGLPLLVDVDTGFGSAFNIARTVRSLIRVGAAALHIEDQVQAKRCGHRPGKALVSKGEMVDRIKAAVDARSDPSFGIMARTDALAVEGLAAAVERARAYVEAGADMLFPEAVTDPAMYAEFASAVGERRGDAETGRRGAAASAPLDAAGAAGRASTPLDAAGVPILANMTEFGKTPLLTVDELARAGVDMVLYPLSAFRAMSAAAQRVYETIRRDGTQAGVLPEMQTREELYDVLNYHAYEQKLDELFAKENQE